MDWDQNLKLSDENFGKKMATTYYDSEAGETNPFPSDYILAQFAKIATFDQPYPISEDWTLLTTAQNEDFNKNGYFGAAFFNRKLCQVVIAHRGISIPSGFVLHSVALFNRIGSYQAQSAITFVHKVGQVIKSINSFGCPRIQLSITGYSLGAWLSQVTTFTIKYLKNSVNIFVANEDVSQAIHAHTVVFHSPGCRNFLEELIRKCTPHYICRKYINYDKLDMSVYLGKERSNNLMKEQVGTVFLLDAFLNTMDEYISLFNAETHKIEDKLVLDFMSVDKNRRCFSNECSLNVFNQEELEFVKLYSTFAKNFSTDVLLKIRAKYKVPYFEIDQNFDIIRSEELNRVVAFVKLLTNKKRLIQDFCSTELQY